MTGRRTLLLLASALLAALGTALVWLYVQGATARAESDVTLTPVLTVTAEADSGTPAANLHLGTVQVTAQQAELAVRSQAEVAGQVLVTKAVPGQPLLRSMFGTTPIPDVRPTDVGVALPITDARRVAALLEPGQEVAVYVVPPSGCPNLVLDRARVARVGSAAPAGAVSGGTAQQVAQTIVTFDVSPADSMKLLAVKPADDVALAVLGAKAVPAVNCP